jgi:hypothetical protein
LENCHRGHRGRGRGRYREEIKRINGEVKKKDLGIILSVEGRDAILF